MHSAKAGSHGYVLKANDTDHSIVTLLGIYIGHILVFRNCWTRSSHPCSWMDTILGSLLPTNETLLKQLIKVFRVGTEACSNVVQFFRSRFGNTWTRQRVLEWREILCVLKMAHQIQQCQRTAWDLIQQFHWLLGYEVILQHQQLYKGRSASMGSTATSQKECPRFKSQLRSVSHIIQRHASQLNWNH